MKNTLYSFLLLFSVLNCCLAQSNEGENSFNAFHSDTELTSFNLAYTYKVGKKIWLGLGIGGGLSIVKGNFKAPFENDWTKENYHFRFYLSNNPKKKFNYEIGTLFGQINHDAEKEEYIQGQRIGSGYIRLFYGWEKFKVGSQFSIGGFSNANETIWMWTPIILRYNIFTPSSNK